MSRRRIMGVWTAVGVGVGVALGTALHDLAVWTAMGAAIGALMEFFMGKKRAG